MALAASAVHQRPPPAFSEAVNEIMEVYRSLPTRPTLEEVEAARAVVSGADAEEEARLAEIGRRERPPGVPEELLTVLRESRKGLVLLQCYEQRREALHVLELERRFEAFDDLVQKASRLVAGEGEAGEEERKRPGLGAVEVDVRKTGRREEEEKREEAKVVVGQKEFLRTSSLNFSISSDDAPSDKLSLIKVAGLIETSVKSGAKVLNLKGRLMDQVEWLPLSLGKLLDITDLNLSENHILALPTTIGSLRFLTKLDLHSNQLINLPDTFVELSSLTDLDLHGNQIKSLPADFGVLTGLINLDLSSNLLKTLPDSMGKLPNLRRLDVETNELEELPYTIGSCCSLTELRLDFNQLRALPEATGKLESLEILTLHYNRVSGLPTTLASLTKLKELDISFNEIEVIPESLCFATSLVKLNVSNNFADLRSLPKSIGNLEMLEELNISNNQIRFLPDSFRLLSKLRVLEAYETPLEVPPRAVVMSGAQAAVQYMIDLLEPKEIVEQPREKQEGFCSWLGSLCCGTNQPQTTEATTNFD